MKRDHSLTGSASLVFAVVAQVAIAMPRSDEPPAAAPAPKVEPAKVEPVLPAQGKEAPKLDTGKMTALDKLQACDKLYASAKSYRDEGEVVTKIVAPGMTNTSKAPFSTAFKRGGGFFWEFRSSAVPGAKPDQQYFVWSADQKKFHDYWTLTKEKSDHATFDSAMGGPTGISGGSATLIIPLLRPTMTWGVRATAMTNPVEKGTEKVDGHTCQIIEGTQFDDSKVTLWLDENMAIRKYQQFRTIDPSKVRGVEARGTPKFTAESTITVKPEFDGKIDDKTFEAPAAAK